MEQEPDFRALRNLLAIKKLEMPLDTEVNRFLIEFHRRQRAQLLTPQSRWSRVIGWMTERLQGLAPIPSLSYVSGLAALALLVFLGVSQQVQGPQADGHFKLALRMASAEPTLAMVPVSFVRDAQAPGDGMTFNPGASKAAATRFVLANSRVAYDATAAF